MRTVSYDKLKRLQKLALDEAEQALTKAYPAYSRFAVGACLVTADGELITGANVENAAYGSTLCAERAAVLRANAEGKRDLRSIAVIGRPERDDPDKRNANEVTGPCGSCRQVLFEMAEVAGTNLEVILSSSNKDVIVITSIKELLPRGFGPANLGIDISKYRPRPPSRSAST